MAAMERAWLVEPSGDEDGMRQLAVLTVTEDAGDIRIRSQRLNFKVEDDDGLPSAV